MKIRPILFKPLMVRAILDGHKKETRRFVNRFNMEPGDSFWVKESSLILDGERIYKADHIMKLKVGKWNNSLYATRESSRLILPLTAVRRERLGDITEAGAIAEGVGAFVTRDMEAFETWPIFYKNKIAISHCLSAIDSFISLWESINGDWEKDKDKEVFVFSWNDFELTK